MRLTNLALSSTLLLSLVACRGSDNNNGDDVQPMPDAPPPGGNVTIMEIQNDAMPVGTQVSVKGVVVTAIDSFGNRTGDFFVQDPAGGPFSGIKVFGAPLDQVATLAVGDVIDISNAVKDEFALTSDMSGRKVTELKPIEGGAMTLTKKSTGTVPAPAAVDAKALAAMAKADREAEWEKWEGVLITVSGARQLADTNTFGSMPGPDSTEFRITGIARVQSGLTELPAEAAFGVCYEKITGVGDYFFNDIVLPRSADDLVAGGTGCNPMATTINALQTGTNVELVSLTDVFVAGISFNKKHLWLSSSLTAAPNEGVYVYRGGSTASVLPPDVVVGAKVNVVGAGDEFNNDAMGEAITQVVSPSITVTAAPTTPPVPVVGQTVADLNEAATGEPYESVLVTLTNVKVTTLGTSANFGVGTLTQYPGATVFKSDDDIYRFAAADLDMCFATITGFWSYSVYENSYIFLPIAVGTGTGACN